MLAAFATTDGKYISQHFGHTPVFLIVEIDEGKHCWHPVARRENAPACHLRTHDDGAAAQSIAVIADCAVVFAAKIGPAMKTLLERHGIQALELTGFIDDVLEGYLRYLDREAERRAGREQRLRSAD